MSRCATARSRTEAGRRPLPHDGPFGTDPACARPARQNRSGDGRHTSSADGRPKLFVRVARYRRGAPVREPADLRCTAADHLRASLPPPVVICGNPQRRRSRRQHRVTRSPLRQTKPNRPWPRPASASRLLLDEEAALPACRPPDRGRQPRGLRGFRNRAPRTRSPTPGAGLLNRAVGRRHCTSLAPKDVVLFVIPSHRPTDMPPWEA